MVKDIAATDIYLLRGLAREVRHWGGFTDKLCSSAVGLEVFPLEIPGAGILRHEQSPFSTAEYVSRIRKQYLQRNRPDRCNILAGLSFGGMIAAQWMHDFPADFAGVVLLNCSSRPSPVHRRLLPSAAVSFLRFLLSGDIDRRERLLAGLLCNIADAEEVGRNWAEISRDAPIPPSNALRQLGAAIAFTLPQTVEAPVLVLCSQKDRLVSSACSMAIAKAWSAPLVSHPEAGHDLTTDDPDWCSSQILAWLRQLQPQNPSFA